jgi:hypothetical protein
MVIEAELPVRLLCDPAPDFQSSVAYPSKKTAKPHSIQNTQHTLLLTDSCTKHLSIWHIQCISEISGRNSEFRVFAPVTCGARCIL